MPPRAAKPPEEQFLTAVFELRPTRRKAAALERVRDAAVPMAPADRGC